MSLNKQILERILSLIKYSQKEKEELLGKLTNPDNTDELIDEEEVFKILSISATAKQKADANANYQKATKTELEKAEKLLRNEFGVSDFDGDYAALVKHIAELQTSNGAGDTSNATKELTAEQVRKSPFFAQEIAKEKDKIAKERAAFLQEKTTFEKNKTFDVVKNKALEILKSKNAIIDPAREKQQMLAFEALLKNNNYKINADGSIVAVDENGVERYDEAIGGFLTLDHIVEQQAPFSFGTVPQNTSVPPTTTQNGVNPKVIYAKTIFEKPELAAAKLAELQQKGDKEGIDNLMSQRIEFLKTQSI
jgi:hypothetical protein